MTADGRFDQKLFDQMLNDPNLPPTLHTALEAANQRANPTPTLPKPTKTMLDDLRSFSSRNLPLASNLVNGRDLYIPAGKTISGVKVPGWVFVQGAGAGIKDSEVRGAIRVQGYDDFNMQRLEVGMDIATNLTRTWAVPAADGGNLEDVFIHGANIGLQPATSCSIRGHRVLITGLKKVVGDTTGNNAHRNGFVTNGMATGESITLDTVVLDPLGDGGDTDQLSGPFCLYGDYANCHHVSLLNAWCGDSPSYILRGGGVYPTAKPFQSPTNIIFDNVVCGGKSLADWASTTTPPGAIIQAWKRDPTNTWGKVYDSTGKLVMEP